jgi:citrate lyase subunit beta/citryl-CoA lyase
MPASNARALEKARVLDVDGVVFDLEDAVVPVGKGEARSQAVAAARAGGYGRREVVIRVNGAGTPWGRDDLAAAATSGADAVLLPKVESAAAVAEAVAALTAHGAPPALSVWCMLETPRGVLAADAIAAGGRVGALVMGTSDLTADLRARHTAGREPLLLSLALCVLAARAHGLAALDGVHLDLADTAGLERACRQARDLGFDGKTLIHPSQLAAANAAFAPTREEVAWAERVVEAHAAAERSGQGVALVDGRLVEKLHVEDAKRMLALAGAIAGGAGTGTAGST